MTTPSLARVRFLTVASLIALAVGTFATGWPEVLLASKGVEPRAATVVWVREVGVLLLAIGGVAFALRRQPDSPALRAFLLGNGALQAMLFPIELLAYRAGTITSLAGIVPNSVLHAALTVAFFGFGLRVPRVER